MTPNRRELFLALAAAAAARAADGPVAIPGKRPMILHNDRPEDLETPLRYFDSYLTPDRRVLRAAAPSASGGDRSGGVPADGERNGRRSPSS